MKDVFKVHEVARSESGIYAGLGGTVTDTREKQVRVLIEGVREGEPFTAHAWVPRSSVERNHG